MQKPTFDLRNAQ